MSLHAFYTRSAEEVLADPRLPEMHEALLGELEAGALRAAEPTPEGWRVNAWVKQAILFGFRHTNLVEMPGYGLSAVDKTAFPPRTFRLEDGVRMVPGGSAARRGAHLAKGVVVMPPAYVNVGAFVDEGTMVDSHALVGSCAQVGKRVHLSAGAQVGGVLEPAGAQPVIIEDEAFVGGLVGLFEGIHVGRRAVLASGVVLTAGTVIHDLVMGRTWVKEVPEGAVVVPGSRPASGDYAKANGIQLATPVIVKYRDPKTDAATALEEALR
ncbi:MAG TPA: 2,3,4,5-tetrahydropyridine-2,6-dicarboxylate N-succinyltransferase [Holophagaceae bacterium]|nr:2,3,4,5-tetrahydropyridine-2,6-dicarboxylate N-succinyltransferase [Holophagaceae bacterium]HJW31815.1 2,3,4,5-tetrahydropyridine-2,6-dicarboxylate N-succinyltransferase [Holophagaceae bacterium]